MKRIATAVGLVVLSLGVAVPAKAQTGSMEQATCHTSIKYGDNSKAGSLAKVNGIKMYYEIYGNPARQPLLLIHGNGGSIFSERCQIEYFKNQYRIIVADSRFHGRTEDGSELLTYDLMAKDYKALLDYLKIDSAYILGQSDGGIIGLIIAIKHPEKVKKSEYALFNQIVERFLNNPFRRPTTKEMLLQ